MMVQEYRIPLWEDNKHSIEVGGDVYRDDDSNEIVGFVSDVDATSMQITLFRPTDISKYVSNVISFTETLSKEELFDKWANLPHIRAFNEATVEEIKKSMKRYS